MADSIYTFDPTPANNTALDSIPYGPNQLYHNQIDNWFRALGSKLAQFVDDLGAVNTVAGTGDAVTVTLASGITAYATGQFFRFIAGAANTGAATMNVNSIGAKAIRKISGGTDVALSAGDIAAGETYLVRYSTAANAAAGAWIIVGAAAVAAATTSAAGIVNLSQLTGPVNVGLAASVAASALTISLKGVDGNDPSASNPVYVPFRNVTAATGTPTWLAVTAATSIVVSSGSTLGTSSGVADTLAIVAFNDGGTFRLGVINPTTLPLQDGIASSTAEGGAGGADSAGVFYTATAVTSKAYTVLGYAIETQATAGTWATVPSTLQIADAASANLALSSSGGTSGLTLLTSGTVSSAATLDIPLTSYTSYRGILVQLINFIPATDNADLWLRVSTNGGSSYDSGVSDYMYGTVRSYSSTDSVLGTIRSTAAAQMIIGYGVGNASSEGCSVQMTLMGQTNTAIKPKMLADAIVYTSTDESLRVMSSGLRNAAQDTDAIRFLFSSGNVSSGSYAVYGYV